MVYLSSENFPNSQQSGKNSRVPCPNSAQSRFPRSSQFPNPVNIFCIFPDPALYFGQIPDPENILPDPVSKGRGNTKPSHVRNKTRKTRRKNNRSDRLHAQTEANKGHIKNLSNVELKTDQI